MSTFAYCIEQLKGNRKCRIQCGHCAFNFNPSEKNLQLLNQIRKIQLKIKKGQLQLDALKKQEFFLVVELEGINI